MSWEVKARKFLEAGQKINAIKAVREGTNMSLRQAVDLVEAWDRGETVPLPATGSDGRSRHRWQV